MPLTAVDDQVETKLVQQISQIPGVAQVTIGGQQTPAIRIQLDPAKLVAKDLSLEEVRTPLSVATVDDPKGTIYSGNRAFTIYTNDQLTQAKAWNNVIVAYRNDGPLRVSDIGQAVEGPQDTTQAAWADGKRAVFLVIYKQPGANVIDTVDKIMAELPRIRASMPSSIDIGVLSDRTQTIRASVHDVQFTLLLTIALVVAVIFVFLRSLWATIIPSVTVPLALLGAFALMWAAGYTLDNLSLMALTISVGFVVDDAIVMLENITRYIEEGEEPLAAALKGSGEIGFTIMSISVSLIAVLIPLLLMGGIIGRLFREFAVTLSMTIVVSAVVSLTLTPMMASRFLTARERHASRPSLRAERARLRCVAEELRARPRRRARNSDSSRCWFFSATLVLTVYLFVIIPKGFFPQQDTGLLTGISQAAQGVSVKDMMRHQEALGAIVMKDPGVEHVAMAIGGTGNPSNTGRMFITLKPRDQRDVTADQIITRLQPQLAKVEGAQLFLQASQDLTVGGRAARTQYQYTLQDSDFAELNTWAPKMLAKMQAQPELRDVASDQEVAGTTLTLTFDRDQASRYGLTAQTIDDTLYDAFGQREIAQYFTQLSSYEVIMEVLPSLQEDLATLDKIFLKSSTGGEVPLSTFAKWSTTPVQPLAISHQGQFPATTISFNLGAGRGAQSGDRRNTARPERAEASRHRDHQLPGQCAGVPGVADDCAAADRGGAGRRLSDPRHPLRKLHPPDHDSVDPAFGGRRGAGDADAVPFRLQPDRADRHHPLDRHREEERHHAGRFRDESPRGRTSLRARRHSSRGAAALPPHHDDDDGGASRRRAAHAGHGHGLRDPATARLRHGRGPDRQPGPDVVHDAGDLYLSRPTLGLARQLAPSRGESHRRDSPEPCRGRGMIQIIDPRSP